jgi:hypothetical protein
MRPYFNPTEIEQNILGLARRLLGDTLAAYLLSGLGETDTINCRVFTAQSEKVSYWIEMRCNSDGKGLPAGKDLLVMATLIDLLRERQPLDSRITLRDSDIIERLQWPNTPESSAQIRQALERYFLTAYYLVDPAVDGDEIASCRYASSTRLLIIYETASPLLPLKRPAQQRLTKVQFLPGFSYDILSESKRFLGIDFNALRELREIPVESSEGQKVDR